MTLFKSFFIGGFECATHYGQRRTRLDLLAATGHDRFVALDYARLRDYGIYTVREGVRWHRIETSPGFYAFGEVLSQIRTAANMGIQVIWDGTCSTLAIQTMLIRFTQLSSNALLPIHAN